MFGKNNDTPDLMLFAIFDSKVGAYWEPRMAQNSFDALRLIENSFRNEQQRKDYPLFLNAEDYSLFKIGEYTKKTGTLKSVNPEHIADMHQLKSSVLRSETTSGH